MARGTEYSSSTESPSTLSPSNSSDSFGHGQNNYEPIAIVGMACRWPGDVDSGKDLETPSALWDFLQQRKNAYGDFPSSRLNIDSWYHPNTNRPGSFYTKGGAFLKSDPREFDPTFFGINPQEATSMDPAQRKFLEVIYEALESSGTPLEKVSGTKTGCFVGNFNYDHQLMQYRDTEYPEPYGITGGGIALLSNRVSYVFNLQGPSLTLDTACSSSMYALHLACSAIHSGDCKAALVGGSNLILTPECQVFSSALGAVSKSSICHTFDASADGYARADGIGALFVKPLSAAIRDGDPIRAIIRGTAFNANGRTGGITHPDPNGQEQAIRRAYERAGLDPSLTTYFECHGTGTPVGDPLECEAIARVFEGITKPERPLLIGSIKSNMGHCESASGMAGIMKTILALENRVLPPIRALDKLNPNIDLKGGRLHIVQKSTDWDPGHIRRASVNSFGYGGANAHTILEAIDSLAPGCGGVRSRQVTPSKAQSTPGGRAEMSERRHFLLPFSAHNSRTLTQNINALQPLADDWKLVDVAYTLSCRRSVFSSRGFTIAEDGKAQQALHASVMQTNKAIVSSEPKLGFVFTGQGAQWPQMGLDLMKSFPTYLRSIRMMDEILSSIPNGPDWGIESALIAPPGASRIYGAELSQCIVTAVQVAIVDLLGSWNIKPTVVVGHSSGEIAAAYISGRISIAEAILSAYARGQAVKHNGSNGAMLAVGARIEAVEKYLSRYQNVNIACHNSQESFTISGDAQEIQQLNNDLQTDGIFARILATGGNAYHSSHMKKLGSDYERNLQSLLHHFKSIRASTRPRFAAFVSSVTSITHPSDKPIDASYWRQNLESPVLFDQAVSHLVETHTVDQLIEIGPHSALQGPIRQIQKASNVSKFPEYAASLIRKNNGAEDILTLAGSLWTKGCRVDLQRVNSVDSLDSITNAIIPCQSGNVVVDLPKYQWCYTEKFYVENRWTREWRQRTHARHDILGSRTPGGNWNEPTWRNVLKQKDLPWLADHKIGSDIVFPAAGYLSMAIEAVTQMVELGLMDASAVSRYELHDVQILSAMIIPESGGIEVLFSLRRTRLNSKICYNSRFDFTITSVTPSEKKDVFTELAHGQISYSTDKKETQVFDSANNLSRTGKQIPAPRWYERFGQVGLNYGLAFNGLTNIRVSAKDHTAQAHVSLNPTQGIMTHESRYIVHPAALDATLQLAILAGHDGRASRCETAFLPIAFETLTLWPNSTSAHTAAVATAQTKSIDAKQLSSDLTLAAPDGQFALSSHKVLFTAAETVVTSEKRKSKPCARLTWRPDITLLNSTAVQSLFPTTYREGETKELAVLDQLAVLQTIQFSKQYPVFFETRSEIPHLQRFLLWMSEKVKLAASDGLPQGRQFVDYTIEERAAEIDRLEASLMEEHGPEGRLMCHMYRSLPAIYRGEVIGIHAATQDNLLEDMYAHMKLYHDGSVALKDLVVLLSHKNPKLKILEVGGGTGSATREILPALRGHTDQRGYDKYTFTDIGKAFLANAAEEFKDHKGVVYAPFDMQTDALGQGFDSDHDLIIASNVIHATIDIQGTLKNIRRLLKPGGKLVLFEFVQARPSWNMILGTFSDFWNGDQDKQYPRTEGPFLTRPIWHDVLPKSGFKEAEMMLDHFSEQGEAAIIMTEAVELNMVPTSLNPSPKALSIVHRGDPSGFVTDFARYALSKGVPTELISLSTSHSKPQDRLVFLVEAEQAMFSNISENEWETFKSLISSSHSALYVTKGGLLKGGNPEFAMISGLACAIHTETQSSRLVTLDLDQNESCRQTEFDNILALEEKAFNYKLGDDFEYRSQGGVVCVSRLLPDHEFNNSICSQRTECKTIKALPLKGFRQKTLTLSNGQDKIQAQTTFKIANNQASHVEDDEVEIEVRAGSVHTDLDSNTLIDGGFSGIVKQIGAKVSTVKPGQNVFGIVFGPVSTVVRVKAKFCAVMESERFTDMAAAVAPYCAALYAIDFLGHVEASENVYVESPDSPFGKTAIEMLKARNVQVYTGDERPDSALCQSFDCVISSAQGEDLHNLWQLIASHGRFIDYGRGEALKNGSLSMKFFQRNATFSSFDLQSIALARPNLVAKLLNMARVITEGGFNIPYGYHVVSMSSLIEPLSSSAQTTVLSIDPSIDVVSVIQDSSQAQFSSDAWYILVGCLGGLGRSFAEWMVQQGVRNLVFMSRSGAAGQEAQDFLLKLKTLSINARVVQGNVAVASHVERAVAACQGPIKGVVQGALTLHDSFFNKMSLQGFRATVEPRVLGTLNLHTALEGADLDFFLLWSSWTTIFGSASQGNYMASNSFMDAFANFRRSKGLPAISVGLGHILDIGVVSYNPQYQENLLCMGLYGNTEEEFIRYNEIAIADPVTLKTPRNINNLGIINNGHLLTGVEPSGLLDYAAKYPLAEMSWYRDPRFACLVQATEHMTAENTGSSTTMGTGGDGDNPNDPAIERILQKLARLLYVAKEDMGLEQPIKTYGIDSMVAAELRNWLFAVFGIDVSLLRLLSPEMTITKLAAETEVGDP